MTTTITCVGTAVLDHVYEIDVLPGGEGKHFATSKKDVGGGPAASAAVAICRLGGAARYVGGLGTDHAGDDILADLDAEGVDTGWVGRSKLYPSPTSAVIVDRHGERLIVNHTDRRLMEGLEERVAEATAGVDAVLADLRWPVGAIAGLRAAAGLGIPGIVDFDQTDADTDITLLGSASHVVFSQPALAELTGDNDPAVGLQQMRDRIPAWLAVTAGSAGTFYLSDHGTDHVPAFDVAVVDTLGAGDVFHGAFALAIGQGLGPKRALVEASAAAAIKCTRAGGRSGAPNRYELNAFLKERRTWN